MRRGHRGLRVWEEGLVLVEQIYRVTRSFPSTEIYGRTAQMRRAAVSVPSNIAEGYARASTRDLLRFLSISAGSLSELDTLVELAQRLGFLNDTEELKARIEEVSGMLMGLQTALRKKLS